MPAMSPCTCAVHELTAVRFAQDVVLLRCARHEQQAWTVAGRPASAARAHAVLRAVFDEGRSRRGQRRTTPRHHVVRLTPAPPPATTAEATTAEALTALLHARGLEGSWSLA